MEHTLIVDRIERKTEFMILLKMQIERDNCDFIHVTVVGSHVVSRYW